MNTWNTVVAAAFIALGRCCRFALADGHGLLVQSFVNKFLFIEALEVINVKVFSYIL